MSGSGRGSIAGETSCNLIFSFLVLISSADTVFCFICTFFVVAGLPGILSGSSVTTAEVVTTPLRQALSTCASATEGIVFVDQYILYLRVLVFF